MDDIIETVELLEKSGLLIDEATETVKHDKKRKGGFLGVIMAPVGAALVQLLISSVVKGITERGGKRAGNRQEGGVLYSTDLLAKAITVKRFMRADLFYRFHRIYYSMKNFARLFQFLSP